MSIYDEVNQQMKAAMRARDKARLAALRGIRTAFINEQKKNNADTISDDQAIANLRRLAKQRKDSIDAFTQAGDEDRASAERAELSVIEEFLPALADEETTRAWVKEAIAQVGATEPGHVGKVMGAIMRAHRGDVDGGLAKKIAAEELSA
ncbi:MAG: GatB/YqeY domain-containing protein [Myxococcota bacterium]